MSEGHAAGQSSTSPSTPNSTGSTLLDSATPSPQSTLRGSFDKDVDLHRLEARQAKQKDYEDVETGLSSDEEHDRLLPSLGAGSIQPVAGANALPIDEIDEPLQEQAPKPEKPKQISWSALPRKDQLTILTLARLSEPLTQTSLQSYMFYQLRSFSPEAPDSTISYQAGLLQAAFTGAQFCTAVLWGRTADSELMGRKKVILVGLLGTAIGAVGFGFSSSFGVALFWRAIGGALNGNIGVMRTMISEIVKEKKFQSRAFLLLPMTFNIGVIVGPILGGLLADPVSSYPGLFGPGSVFGGKDGVWWMKKWPYALPNLVSAMFLLSSAIALLLGLEESLEALRGKPDYGRRIGLWILRTVFRRRARFEYSAISDNDIPPGPTDTADDIEMRPHLNKPLPPLPRQKLPFRRIWTSNVIFTLIAHGFLASHVGTFNSLWFVFLSTPRYNPLSIPANNGTDPNESLHLPPDYKPHPPFSFTGGLALPPPSIGTALAILGVIGITLQLLLYPPLSFRLGTIPSWRLSLCLFPLAYFLAPFLAIVPSSSAPPHPASGAWLWLAITAVLSVQVLARTFALPATAILVNNASPHPSVLGTIHGIGQSVSSAARTVGPVAAGWLYGLGLSRGVVGLAWWCMAGVSIVGAAASVWVREGDGHEIWLEGEREREEDERGKG